MRALLGRADRSGWLLWLSVVVWGALALLAFAPRVAAEPASSIALNEINCTGTDWVEVINNGATQVSLAGWLLTDDKLDRVPLRDTHRMRFGADAVLAPGARIVVSAGAGGFPFGISCGDDVIRLADTADTLVDSVALPLLATCGTTYGRISDGTGGWTWTLPTPGAANAVAPDSQADDPAWLYDPLQVTEIDLEATPAALTQLTLVPTEYVDARITLRNAGTTYGPYAVGLRMKGHSSFRWLNAKTAFKVKFGCSVAGQGFHGLKSLTLNNMVQDPSMIAEATSSLLIAATGAPAARVGYAYVRLNGAEYGLYADVETIDAVMAHRWWTGTQHVYEGTAGVDATPGRAGDFEVDEGSSTDLSDLEALIAANAGGTEGWAARMQAVADLTELTRVWAAEHYIGHWDGYSFAIDPWNIDLFPDNYYLHSDLAGRFSFIASGTDQTWDEHSAFGALGVATLMHGCVADATCRGLYIDALRQIAASPAVAALPAKARAIRAVIAPWRARDPRMEQTAGEGEERADAKLATLEARPAELRAWLADPTFAVVVRTPSWSGGSSADLSVIGSVNPPSAPLGGSHVWWVQVTNSGTASAPGVVLDVQISPNAAVAYTRTTRGPGCAPTATGLHCELDFLGAAGNESATAQVVIGTDVIGTGEVTLTATSSFVEADPTPADDTVVLKANSIQAAAPSATPPVVRSAIVRPVLGKLVTVPAKPAAGKRLALSLVVTRSDTGARLRTGTMDCDPSVAGKVIKHSESFTGGTARLSFVVPGTAKGKTLKVKIQITTSGRSAAHTYSWAIH